MAQSAMLGFGVSPQIKGLGGGVDRKWVAVSGVKKEHFGQRKGLSSKAILLPIHSGHLRGPPALRCSNQKHFQGWPRVQEPPKEEKEQGDAQPTYKAPSANPPPGYFPIQTGYGYPYPPYNQGDYPNYPPYPYSPHQQFYPNAGYPPQQLYPQYPPQQMYPPQQPNPPSPHISNLKEKLKKKLSVLLALGSKLDLSVIADLLSIFADIESL